MRTPIIKDWTIRQGEDLSVTVRYRGSDGRPVDVTGWTFRMQVRAAKSASSALLVDLTSSIVVDPTNGLITWTLTAAQSVDDLTQAISFYDLKGIGPTGKEKRVRQGRFILDTQVTP